MAGAPRFYWLSCCILRLAALALVALAWPMQVAAQSIAVPTTVDAGHPLTFTLTNGPGNPMDWVGLYATGTVESRGNYLQWQFLNGTQAAPTTGRRSTELQFTAPLTAGTYNLRWFANGGYVPIATSATISIVNGAPPPPQPPPVSISGRSIVFNGDSNVDEYVISGPDNWTRLVTEALDLSPSSSMALRGKYAAGVLAEAPTMAALQLLLRKLADLINLSPGHAVVLEKLVDNSLKKLAG